MDRRPYLLIPTYEKYEEAKQDLQDLLTSLRLGSYNTYFRIVVLLDSCSRIFHSEFESKFGDIAEFWNHSGNNLGFAANVDRGLRKAREEGTGSLVVNQDCILPSLIKVTSMCRPNLMTCAKTMDLPNKALEEVIRLLGEGSLREGDKSISVKEIAGNRVAGYLFWLAPEVLKKVGVLDDISFRSSFEDDDMTVRCLLAGFDVMVEPIYCYHKGSHMQDNNMSRSGAYGAGNGSLGLHQLKYYEKWKIPGSIKHENAIIWILQNYQWSRELSIE